MRFASPEYFLLLILVLIISLSWFFLQKIRVKKLKKHFSQENLKSLGLSTKNSFPARMYRTSLALFLMFTVIALARPQFGSSQVPEKVSENSVVFMLDLSRSMLTKDVMPSRLELLKTEVLKTLKVLGDIRVGLVIFAGNVEVVSPMTSDLGAIEDYVNSLSVDSITTQGTEIKTALDEASGVFERSSFSKSKEALAKEDKVIILFTDGEDHEKETVKFVKSMYNKGYKLFTVGVGSESGGFIPEGEGTLSYIKDASGQPVVSKPNFKFLKELAEKGGGSFYYLSPGKPLGPKLKKGIAKVQAMTTSKRDFIVRNEIYQLFLMLSFFSLLIAYFFKRSK